MSAIRRRARTFLGLPALDDPGATKRPRIVPWLAAPAVFGLALAVLIAIGVALQKALHSRDNWQVNAPAIAALTTILLLAPSSPTQPRARNALVAAIVGLAVVSGGYALAVAGHQPGTTYTATAFLIAAVGALAGCVEFTALTHIDRWSAAAHNGSTAGSKRRTAGAVSEDAADADATDATDAPPADT
jgi:hypothetical protein